MFIFLYINHCYYILLILAPSDLSRPSMSSYPRSIWLMFSITLVPSAQRAAISSAMPALMSGDDILAGLSLKFSPKPMTVARCGSQSIICAPMSISLSRRTGGSRTSSGVSARCPSPSLPPRVSPTAGLESVPAMAHRLWSL